MRCKCCGQIVHEAVLAREVTFTAGQDGRRIPVKHDGVLCPVCFRWAVIWKRLDIFEESIA